MKKLNVTLTKQIKDNDCMLACLHMLMRYYGHSENFEDMHQHFSFYSMGISMPQIGKYAIEKGFNTSFHSLNPYIFNTKDIGKSPEDVLIKIQNIKAKTPEFEGIKQSFVDYIHAGGHISPTLLTKDLIIKEIDSGHPVITLLTSTVIHGHNDGYNFHANIVYGYNDDSFFILDPETPELGGGDHIINQDLTMCAIHAMAYADLDNASYIKIWK